MVRDVQQTVVRGVVCDAREGLPFPDGKFETAIMGDMLEHFLLKADIVSMTMEGMRVLQPGGILIVTCPEDHRPLKDQGYVSDYEVPNINPIHTYPVTFEVMRDTPTARARWCRNGAS